MTRWYGKLLGLIVGALLFRPNPLLGALVGLLIGHAFDSDALRAREDDPYRELGVAPDASDDEIDRAYRRLISQYHPDRLGGATPERRAEGERRASAINAAYDRIRALRRRP